MGDYDFLINFKSTIRVSVTQLPVGIWMGNKVAVEKSPIDWTQDNLKLIKKQNLNSAIENSNSIQSIILSVQSTINPASSKSSIASDQINNKKVKIKPHFEIHVWNGKETSLITQVHFFV